MIIIDKFGQKISQETLCYSGHRGPEIIAEADGGFTLKNVDVKFEVDEEFGQRWEYDCIDITLERSDLDYIKGLIQNGLL